MITMEPDPVFATFSKRYFIMIDAEGMVRRCASLTDCFQAQFVVAQDENDKDIFKVLKDRLGDPLRNDHLYLVKLRETFPDITAGEDQHVNLSARDRVYMRMRF